MKIGILFIAHEVFVYDVYTFFLFSGSRGPNIEAIYVKGVETNITVMNI